jgi:hypothetical protein
VTYDGNRRRRELALEAVETGRAEVMIVAFPTFQDKDKFTALKMGRVNWKAIIIDELHVCKNDKAEVTMNLRTFRDTYKCVVVGLTGKFVVISGYISLMLSHDIGQRAGTIMPNVSACFHVSRIVSHIFP